MVDIVKEVIVNDRLAQFVAPHSCSTVYLQISVWSNNYRMACIHNVSCVEMENLMEWLPVNIPPGPHPITIGN